MSCCRKRHNLNCPTHETRFILSSFPHVRGVCHFMHLRYIPKRVTNRHFCVRLHPYFPLWSELCLTKQAQKFICNPMCSTEQKHLLMFARRFQRKGGLRIHYPSHDCLMRSLLETNGRNILSFCQVCASEHWLNSDVNWAMGLWSILVYYTSRLKVPWAAGICSEGAKFWYEEPSLWGMS